MGKPCDGSFYVVFKWMVSELNLSGTELALYAIIHGFSQPGSEQCFSGGINYLSEMTGKDRSSVIRNLQSLVSKGLLEKKDVEVNGMKFCKYRVSEYRPYHSAEMQLGVAKCDGGGGEMRPNNKEYNKEVLKDKSFNTKTTKATRFVKPTIKEIEDYCLEHNITNVDPEYFFNYYEANGWVQGKNKPIKSWVACLNTWKRNNYGSGAAAHAAPSPAPRREIKIRINEYGEEEAYYDEP